jgi:hypothetical protein
VLGDAEQVGGDRGRDVLTEVDQRAVRSERSVISSCANRRRMRSSQSGTAQVDHS